MRKAPRDESAAVKLWRMADANAYDAVAFSEGLSRVAADLVSKRSTATYDDVVNVLWACARVKHRSEYLFSLAAHRADLVRACSPVHLCWWVWSAAVLQVDCDPVLERANALDLDAWWDAPPGVLCLLLWGASALDRDVRPELFAIAAESLLYQAARFGATRKTEVYMAQLVFAEVLQVARGCSCVLPPDFKPIGCAVSRQVQSEPLVSDMHQEVCAALGSLGVPYTTEVEIDGCDHRVDILLSWKDRVVALEVDGPSHYCRNHPHFPLGCTVARNRLLLARGLDVATVTGWAWSRVSRMSDGARRAFVVRVLDACRGGYGAQPKTYFVLQRQALADLALADA